jgi:hypothetical protein
VPRKRAPASDRRTPPPAPLGVAARLDEGEELGVGDEARGRVKGGHGDGARAVLIVPPKGGKVARLADRHLARLDSEIGGMSVQQLKEKIRSVAATRRERLHGVTQA